MQLKTLIISAAIATASTAVASEARAAPLLFTFTGLENTTFVLDSNPTPTSYSLYSFMVFNLKGTLNGAPHAFPELTFYSQAGAGGISSQDSSLVLTNIGPVVFSGATSNPVFTPGAIFNFPAGDTLTISTVSSVPEPSTWLLMMVGLFGIGITLRAAKNSRQNLSGFDMDAPTSIKPSTLSMTEAFPADL